MPELPEVETVRRCVEPVLTGARLTDVEVRRERMIRRQPNPGDVRGRLVGNRVTKVGRHGKFLQLAINGGAFIWVMHLGMSGRIALAEPGEPELPHTNVVVRHSVGGELRFIDPRTFGFVAVYTPFELGESSLGRLGPDALWDLPDTKALAVSLSGRTAAIKGLLLNQRIIAGLGNIYADEILHRARLHPRRPGGSLQRAEVSRLRRHIRPVLEAGIAAGGTSLADLGYLLPDGRAGRFMVKLRAYGREGEPCLTCGKPIEREVIAQRSSYYCPSCQT